MTPHGCLEDMARMESLMGEHLGTNFNPEVWNLMHPVLQAAVAFDYGAATPSEAHVEFGVDLVRRSLFQLPFGTIFVTSNAMPKTGLLVRKRDREDHMSIVSFGPCNIGDSHAFSGLPMIIYALNETDGDPTINWKSIVNQDAHFSRKTGKKWGESEYHAAATKVITFTLGAVAMLMSKEVETQVIPAPDKLNREREKKGRCPVSVRHVVRIRPEYRKAHAAAGDGSRASPKIHWRRGHFRTIREDLVVPVSPTIVNATDDAKPMAKRYEFAAKGGI